MSDFTLTKDADNLDFESKHLLERAKAALKDAYAPYSKFRVATAVLLADGTVVTGTNQENASYPAGMCAERVALYAIASQHPGEEIKKLVVIAQRENQSVLAPATSCGQCRQVMLEFEQRQGSPFEVVMLNQDQEWVIARSAGSLLPFSFTNVSLRG
jgi:cytidine deaminase